MRVDLFAVRKPVGITVRKGWVGPCIARTDKEAGACLDSVFEAIAITGRWSQGWFPEQIPNALVKPSLSLSSSASLARFPIFSVSQTV